MKKQEITTEKEPNEDQDQAKTKKNTYTPEENKFADGEGTKLDKQLIMMKAIQQAEVFK